MRYAMLVVLAIPVVLLVFVPICTEREWPRAVGFIAHRRRAQCGGTRRGAAGSVQRLGRCVHDAPRHGLRRPLASTVSNRQLRGSRFPGHASLTAR